MKKGIKILSVIGVLVIGLVVAGIAILKTMDFNDYKGLIAEKAKEATGRDLVIAGDIDLEISLNPKLAVEGVSLSNAAWGSQKQMLTVDRFAAEVALIPLLSSTVEVKRLVLEGVTLLAETDKSGAGNWEMGKHSDAATKQDTAAGGGVLPVVHAVTVRDVNIVYKDGKTGESQNIAIQNIDLTADGANAPLMLGLKADLNGQLLDVSGQLGSLSALMGGGLIPLDLKISAFAAAITLKGEAGQQGGATAADLALTVSGADLAATLDAASSLAPGLKSAELPPIKTYSVSTQVGLKGNNLTLANLTVKLDETTLAGQVGVNLAAKTPDVAVKLSSERIDLDKFLPKGKDDAAAAPAKKADDGRVFPADPLPLDGLKAVNAELDLAVKTLIVKGTEVSNLSLALTLKDGKLNIKPLKATVYDGAIVANINLDGAAKTPTLKASVQVKQLDYGAALKAQGQDDIAKGKVDVNLDVTGQGNSVRGLMASLNGKARVQSKDGQIESGALNIVSTDLMNVFDSKDDKKLICAVVDFDIKGGLAKSHALVVETGGFSIVGTGDVDLREEKPNLHIDPRAKKASVATMAMVPIDVVGTLAKPDYKIDQTAMAGNVAAGAARTAGAIATGGLSLLVEKVAGDTVAKIDETDYCTPALAGKRVLPGEMKEASSPKSSGDTPASTAADAPTTPEKKDEGVIEGLGKGIEGGLKKLFGN